VSGCDEYAEGMSRRVGVDVQRFLGIVRAVVEETCPQRKDALVLISQFVGTIDGEIEVKLLRNRRFRLRRFR
jgi:hypothetical protein